MRSTSVDVWFADLDAAATRLDEANARLQLLPPEEHTRAAHIGDPLRAQRWSRARIALRLVLATHVGLPDARAPFVLSPGGKPRFASAGPWFSLSHSGALLLAAVSREGPVGVDLETRTTADMDERRRAAIERAAAELAPHAPLPEKSDVQRFLQAWTRLEAVAKASGAGIGRLLTGLAIHGPAAGLAERQTLAADAMLVAEDLPLRVEDLALGAGTTGAIALPRQATLVLRPFPSSPNEIGALEALAQAHG